MLNVRSATPGEVGQTVLERCWALNWETASPQMSHDIQRKVIGSITWEVNLARWRLRSARAGTAICAAQAGLEPV